MSIGLLRLFLDDFIYRFWMRPDDAVAWTSFLVGLLFVVAACFPNRFYERIAAIPTKVFLGVLAVTAALLSGFYIHHFLRGGPRIVDATTYYLQARELAEGHFAWPLDAPSASYRGRFLLAHDGNLGGIFPPGYPLLLSLGFRFGAPMLVGPVLAAAHVLASYLLVRELIAGATKPSEEAAARGAALFSVMSVGLRYHTADTMSHGATALAITVALALALRGAREGTLFSFVLSGLAGGSTLSMRMVSSLGVLLIVLALAFLSKLRVRAALAVLGGMIPGVLLLMISQWAVTGSLFQSTQLAYYGVSDGPPGCFRYGFGKGIGCVFEHGDFVEHRLKEGHTLKEALETTAFRLKFHMADAFNVELLAILLLPIVFVRSLLSLRALLTFALVVLHIAAYVPFYFDGSYPGGGGRFYADVLGIEIALVASAILIRTRPNVVARLAALIAGLMALGFATRSIREHRLLRDRDGGLPAFQPALAPDTGLMFVDSDAAFALAYASRTSALEVARYRGDAHDFLLYERLKRPKTFHYEFADTPRLLAYVPKPSSRFESEFDWPPLSQEGGYAIPFWPGCASNQRGLVAIPTSPIVRASIELPFLENGSYAITPHIVDRAAHAKGHLELRDPRGTVFAEWSWEDGDAEACRALDRREVLVEKGAYLLLLEGRGGEVALDAVDAEKIGAPVPPIPQPPVPVVQPQVPAEPSSLPVPPPSATP